MIVFYIYLIGMIISCILVSIDAYISYKNNESLDEFSAVFAVMGILSWIAVILYVYKYINLYNVK